ARITDAGDCGPQRRDCVWYVGYSYWRRMNYHVNSPEHKMYILVGLDVDRGGAGPTLFSYNKDNEQVLNEGPLFTNENDPYRLSTAEMWYFSGSQERILYVISPDSKKLQRFDIFA